MLGVVLIQTFLLIVNVLSLNATTDLQRPTCSQWDMDKREGHGLYKYKNGTTYEGEWLDDKANGQGVYTHANGARYSGGWLDDQ